MIIFSFVFGQKSPLRLGKIFKHTKQSALQTTESQNPLDALIRTDQKQTFLKFQELFLKKLEMNSYQTNINVKMAKLLITRSP